MKRLLAQIGLTAFSALAVAFYLPTEINILLSVLFIIAFTVLVIIPKSRRTVFIPAMALSAALAFAVNIGYSSIVVAPIQEEYSGEDSRIEAVLTDEVNEIYSAYYYRLETVRVNGEKVNTKLLLKTYSPVDIEPYDTVSFTADVYATESRYYLSKGYYLSVSAYDDDMTVTPAAGRPLYYSVIMLRDSLRAAFDEYLPEDEAALCKAVFVGDKYALGEDIRDSFRYAGASYFIVVSGMHFSVLCVVLMYLIEKLRQRLGFSRFIALGVITPVVLLYMAVTGFQPSVIRAGVMVLVYLLGSAIRRISDPLSSLGLAALVSVIIFSPYGAGDNGLIISVAATFAIIMWHEPIYEKLSKRLKERKGRAAKAIRGFLSLLSVSLAANILVVPLSVLMFRGVSLVTLISSLLLYIPIWLILVLSLALCVLFYLGPLRYISLLLSWPLYICAKFVGLTVGFLSGLPFSYIHTGGAFARIWLGITVIMGVIVIAAKNEYRYLPIASLLSVIILLSGVIAKTEIDLNTLSLEVYDCSSGMAVGLNIRGTLYMLGLNTDSADAKNAVNRIVPRFNDIGLAVCISKRDFNNYTRFADREFAISDYLLYDNDVKYKGSAELVRADGSTEYKLDDDVRLSVFPSRKKLLSYVEAGDMTLLVIPDGCRLKDIPESCRSADIIVLMSALPEYEALSCSQLIICGSSESADKAADIISASCYDCQYTRDGDVTVDLR